jgi:antirestriction protein
MSKIYIACLASYNNGVLHGKWIEASTDVDAMQSEVNAVLRSSKFPNVEVEHVEEYQVTCSVLARHNGCHVWYMSEIENHPGIWMPNLRPCIIYSEPQLVPSAEEFAIHDFDGEELKGLGEYCGLRAVANRLELAELAESELGDEGPAIVSAYWDNMGTAYMPDDASEAVEAARDAYCGTFKDWTEWAEEYVESSDMLHGVPENIKQYFDYEAYGRDARMNGDIFENEGHYFYNQ